MVYGFQCLRCGSDYAEYQAYCTKIVFEDHRCGGTVSAVYEAPDVRAERRALGTVRLRRQKTAKGFEPIVYEVDAAGKISVPGAHDQRPRRHRIRKEARTIREIEALERKLNRQELDKAEEQVHRRQVARAMDETARRGELRQQMQGWSPLGRELARKAMERTDSRPEVLHQPDVHFDILHNDQSNREPYEDRRTGWKSRRA